MSLVQGWHASATPWLPSGLGTRLDWGPAVLAGSQVLSCRHLNRILEHNPGDFTVTVEAGLALVDLQAALAEHRQWLAIDWPWQSGLGGAGSGSVGGLVARGLSGGLRQRHLGIRDQLIGLNLIRADGTAARAGGKVVKNVAGYDLMRLFTGSWGSLGLITAVTLRTQPIPPGRRGLWITGALPQLEIFSARLLASSLTPERLDWWSPALAGPVGLEPSHGLLLALTSISAGALEDQVNAVLGLANRSDLTVTAVAADQLGERVRAAEAQPDAAWLLRLAVRPAEVAGLLADRALEGQAVLMEAGSGLGLLQAPAGALPAYRVEELRRRCSDLGGFLTVLRQPPGPELPAWEDAPSRPLIEAVKRQFDPRQQLARGRLPGVNPRALGC